MGIGFEAIPVDSLINGELLEEELLDPYKQQLYILFCILFMYKTYICHQFFSRKKFVIIMSRVSNLRCWC